MTTIFLPRLNPVISNNSRNPIVNTRPIIGSFSLNGDVVAGENLKLCVNATGSPLTYQWQITTTAGGNVWQNITGATASCYTYTGNASDDGKQIRVVITNSQGTSYSEPVTLSVTVPGDFAQVGNSLSISGAIFGAIARLTNTRIAFVDSGNSQLRAYDWNGTTFSLVGSGLNLPSFTGGFGTLARLSSTTVAFYDSINDDLTTYTFNGSTWSQVGSSFSIASGSVADMVGLTATTVAFIESASDNLKLYTWNGSTWSETASTNISGSGNPNLAFLGENAVVFTETNNTELTTYYNEGSTWTQKGNSFQIDDGSFNTGFPYVCRLAYNYIAMIDNGNQEIRAYKWDGEDFSLEGSLDISPVGGTVNGMAYLDEWNIVYFDVSTSELRVYEFISIPATPAYTWSQTGSNLAISGSTSQDACRINTNDVAVINGADGGIQAYRFNGSTWVTLGNFLALAETTEPRLCQLDTNLIAYYSEASMLRVLSFNGTTWSQVGNAYDTGDSPAYAHAIAALSPTRIAVWSIGTLQAYDWNGTDFSPVGNSLGTYSISQGNMDAAGVNLNSIVSSEMVADEVSIFKFDGINWSQEDQYATASTSVLHCAALGLDKVCYTDTIDDSVQVLDWNFINPDQLTHLNNDLNIPGNLYWLRPFVALSPTRIVIFHSSLGLHTYDAVIS